MSSPALAEAFADKLFADMKRAESTVYEEVGVPTFFVAEDLTTERTASAGAADPLGARFAGYAAALTARNPDPAPGDIGKMIQVFAERDFPPSGSDAPEDQPPPAPEPATRMLADIARGMAESRAIRAVNFHSTPRSREAEYRAQIAAYAEAYVPITPANFEAATSGRWEHDRPGLMPLLFEGFRDNLDVLLPILEEHGFTGWFFVPSFFLTVPADEQRAYAEAHELDLLQDEYPGERIALTWKEARDISRRGHVFACHTRHHVHIRLDTPPAELEDEIVVGKAEMEAGLGHGIDIFCWLGGAEIGANPQADEVLRKAGFRYLLSNFKIQKLR